MRDSVKAKNAARCPGAWAVARGRRQGRRGNAARCAGMNASATQVPAISIALKNHLGHHLSAHSRKAKPPVWTWVARGGGCAHGQLSSHRPPAPRQASAQRPARAMREGFQRRAPAVGLGGRRKRDPAHRAGSLAGHDSGEGERPW